MTENFTDEEKRGFYKAIYSRRDVRMFYQKFLMLHIMRHQ
jgi:hypothetical protein